MNIVDAERSYFRAKPIKSEIMFFFSFCSFVRVEFQYEHKNDLYYNVDTNLVTYNDRAIIYKIGPNGELNQLGSWTVDKGLNLKYEVSSVFSGQRFFRVGTAKVKYESRNQNTTMFLNFFSLTKTIFTVVVFVNIY